MAEETTQEGKNDLLTQKTSMLTQHQINTPKSSEGVYELPCGYLDPQGNLYNDVALKEISGHVEDMLGNPKISAVEKMNELIARCVTRIGPYTDPGQLAEIALDLVIGDRSFLTFAVRRVTLGDDYPFRDKCPACEVESLYTIDLSTLEAIKMKDPKKRVHDGKLPSGIECRFHPMTGRDEKRLVKFDKHKTDTLSLAILMRLDTLNGKPPHLNDVKNLGLRDRNYLRDCFQETEGGLDTEVELACPACDHEFKREVDVAQQGFFFPSATLRNSKPKSST